jgi:hypothetical protein
MNETSATRTTDTHTKKVRSGRREAQKKQQQKEEEHTTGRKKEGWADDGTHHTQPDQPHIEDWICCDTESSGFERDGRPHHAVDDSCHGWTPHTVRTYIDELVLVLPGVYPKLSFRSPLFFPLSSGYFHSR